MRWKLKLGLPRRYENTRHGRAVHRRRAAGVAALLDGEHHDNFSSYREKQFIGFFERVADIMSYRIFIWNLLEIP
jgi:hypothetical protein